MRQDEVTLLDIAKAARLIRVFIGDMAKEDFFDDLKTQSSVLYQLLVIVQCGMIKYCGKKLA